MTTLFSAGTQQANTARDNLLSSRFVFGWKLIEESVLTGSVASVTFSSIPGIYRSLAIFVQSRTDVVAVADDVMWRANADAGNNYDRVILTGDAAGVPASGGALSTTPNSYGYIGHSEGANSLASNFAPSLCYWPGYALTDRQKYSITAVSGMIRDANALNDLNVSILQSHWRNTAAITSLTILPFVGPNFISGCRFALYGVL